MRLPDLIRQAVQARGHYGKRFRIRRVARPTYPTALAVAYARNLEVPTRDLVRLVEAHVIANAGGIAAAAAVIRRHDEYGQTLDDIIKFVGQEFANKWPPQEIERLARENALRLSESNRRQLTRILSNSLGVPIFFQDGWAAPEIAAWINTNTSLITSIKDQHLNDVRSLVTSTIRSGRTVQDVTKEIQARYAEDLAGKPSNRAELIARDQVGKFFGNANQLRQRELGVEGYVWRGVLDERERDSHREKEGNRYRWDNPPNDTGHPGEDYQCRCTAEPDLTTAIPTGIPNRESIMRDIAKQQGTLHRKERVEISRPVPAPVIEKREVGSEETPEEVSARIFGSPAIDGGSLVKRKTITSTMAAISAQLGKKAPKTLLPEINLKKMRYYDGAVVRNRFTGQVLRIEVNTKGDIHQAFSLAHELGHMVDIRDAQAKGFATTYISEVIGQKSVPAMRKLMEAIKSSPEIKWIENKRDAAGRNLPIDYKYQKYLLSDRELFARSFCQYMAKETGNKELLAGLDEMRKKSVYYQWSDKHFEPIRKAMKTFLEGRE